MRSIKSIDLSSQVGNKSRFNKIKTWRAFRRAQARKEKKRLARLEHRKWKRDNPFDRLCASGIDPLVYLVELAKGEHFNDGCVWFYGLFLHQEVRMGVYAPKVLEEILERLRAAWWVEEEDILQQLYLWIHQYDIDISRPRNVFNALARPLKDWLVAQRIFNRPFADPSRLTGREHTPPAFLPAVLQIGTLHERYMEWLKRLGMTVQEIKQTVS